MSISVGLGMIIAAIIAAGTAATAGVLQNSALEDASKESEYWANLQREGYACCQQSE